MLSTQVIQPCDRLEDIFQYISEQADANFVSYVEIAAALEMGIPQVKVSLGKLGDRVEDDGDGNYKVVRRTADSTEVSVLDRASTNVLADQETIDLLNLEKKIEKAFYLAGESLAEIQKRKLYRSTHSSFEDYCRDRFGYRKSSVYYLINAAEVYKNLSTKNLSTKNLSTNGGQNVLSSVLPASERQVRSLAKFSPEKQREIWNTAVEEAKGKVPTAKLVNKIVAETKREFYSSIYVAAEKIYSVGDAVCIISTAIELRECKGQLAIVEQVFEFSLSIRCFDRVFENVLVSDIEKLPCDRKAVKVLLGELASLCDRFQDDGAKAFCKRIALKKGAELTEFEIIVLKCSNGGDKFFSIA